MPNTGKQLSEISTMLAAFSADAVTSASNGRTDRAKELERIVGRVLNVVLDTKLTDQNRNGPTFPAIDLGDAAAKIAVQVTIRSDREKVKDALNDFLKKGMEKTFRRLIVMMFVPKVSFRGEIFPDEEYADRDFSFCTRDDVWDLVRLEREIEWLAEEKIDLLWQYLTEQSTVFYPRETVKTPTHLLPGVPAPSSSFVEGSRDRELADLKEKLSPDAPVFLCGVGGIGKTELAIQLAKQAAPEGAYFLHYYDMPGEGEALRETILRADFSGYTYQRADTENRDQEYKERMDILRTEYPGALLVIDNFDRTGKTIAQLMAEPAYRDLTAAGIRLVFTTRSRVRGGYEIKPLCQEHLLKLMRDNLDGAAVADDELRQLIEAVDGHTLMTVLMARTLAESWGDVTAETMLDALRNSDLNRADFPEVVSDQNQSYEQRQIYAHLSALFDLSRLNEADQAVLRCATLLPEDGMDVLTFKTCLDNEPRAKPRRLFEKLLGKKVEKLPSEQEALEHLIKTGWFAADVGSKILTIHPLIREVCWETLEPTEKACQNFLERLSNQVKQNEAYISEKHYQIAKCFALASDRFEDTKGVLSLRTAVLWSQLGLDKEALPYCLRALKHCEENMSGIRVSIYGLLGKIYHGLGEYEQAFGYYLTAMADCERHTHPDDPRLAIYYDDLGLVCCELGDYQEALEYQLKALAILQKNLPEDHMDIVIAYNNVGGTYGKMGDFTRSLEYHLKSLTIERKVLPPDHPMLALTYQNIGGMYGDMCDYDKALEYHLKALAIREKRLPADHLDIAASYLNVGGAYRATGDHVKGKAYLQKSISILEKILPSDHPNLAYAYDHMGGLYCMQKEYQTALDYEQKALGIRKKLLPENHPDFLTSYHNIGRMYGEQGEYDKALEYLEKSLEIAVNALISEHPQITRIQSAIDRFRKEMAEKK